MPISRIWITSPPNVFILQMPTEDMHGLTSRTWKKFNPALLLVTMFCELSFEDLSTQNLLLT